MNDKEINILVYYEDDNVLAVPRFFANDLILTEENKPLVQNNTSCISSDIEFNYQLDQHVNSKFQNEIVGQIVEFFSQPRMFNGGIVTCAMGTGKTIIALKLMDKLKLKTLVIVHRKILLEQWRQFILKFTNLKEDQIGVIEPEAFIYDKPITVAMLQTLLSRDLMPDFDKSFGLTVVDEVSHISAPEWCNVVKKIYSRYTLGLTGTPNKGANLHKIFQYTIGTKLFGYTVLKVKGNVDVYKYTVYIPNYIQVRGGGKYAIAMFISLLTKNNDYNKFLIRLIKQYVSQGKYILIVTDRVKHAELLYRICSELFLDKKFQLLIGGVKTIEYVDGYIGTNQYVAEGINIPHINCLILTVPKYNIKQVVGRLFRNLDKKDITIVDIAHKTYPPVSIIDQAFFPRFNTYKQWGLNIKIMEDKI